MIFNEEHKSQPITKLQVNEAFKQVKANKGSAGMLMILLFIARISNKHCVYWRQ